MNMEEILRAFANGTYRFGDDTIEDNRNNVGAYWDSEKEEWVYCVTGAYNSGTDWEPIDMLALERLKQICETLRGMAR